MGLSLILGHITPNTEFGRTYGCQRTCARCKGRYIPSIKTQITKTLLPDAISRHGGGMEWLKNDMIELGSYTGMQVLVVLMMLILLAFAIWAIRQSDAYRSLSFSDTPLINAVGWAALILALPGALLFVGTLATLFHLAVFFPDASSDESMQRRHATLLLSLLAAIGALVGLVFGLIRVFAVERQTKAQEEKNTLEGEALFNDKMTAATTDLYARRQTKDSAWQDDVPRRNSAIDRLEGLVHERPDQAPRVARLLSVYLRELSGADEVPAQTHPYIRAHALMYPMDGGTPLSAEEAAQKLNATARDISLAALRTWADALKPRSDMENAVQTLGRLRAIAGVDADAVTIDLRAANLQGIDFEGGNFNRARLNGAQLQGANLKDAHFHRADLSDAHLQRANLLRTRLQSARLKRAHLQAADLNCAKLQLARMHNARLQEAILTMAELEGAILHLAWLQEAGLGRAKLQGAKLLGALLQGAYLWQTEFDSETDLRVSDLRGTSFRDVDLTIALHFDKEIKKAFGDGSVILPDHINWPTHWPRERLERLDFSNKLEHFKAKLPP
ncbi:pentapeptide repeat-containing protein, partial [Tateyamaria sp.]|nr:pentapeptide repeat-containing protein [Tateyamaria sp.]